MQNFNEQIRNVLGVVIIIALLVGSYAAFVYARTYAGSMGPTAYRSFGVTGEGKVVVVPDIATFNFGVTTQGGNDIAKLQADNTAKYNRVIEFLKKSGVDEKDIKTSNYAVYPRYQNFNCRFDGVCPPAQIIGYEINQSVDVKIRDFKTIGPILSGIVKEGANTVSNVQFTVDNIKELESEARGLAIKQAEEQAEQVAEAAGFGLGELLSVEEMGPGYPVPYYGMGGDGAMLKETSAVAQAAPSIQPGSQEIVIRVSARYQIK